MNPLPERPRYLLPLILDRAPLSSRHLGRRTCRRIHVAQGRRILSEECTTNTISRQTIKNKSITESKQLLFAVAQTGVETDRGSKVGEERSANMATTQSRYTINLHHTFFRIKLSTKEKRSYSQYISLVIIIMDDK